MRDKRQKFIELAERRVGKAMEQIKLIGNLSNRNNYEYTNDEFVKIISVLETEIRLLKSRFAVESVKRNKSFKL